jgi:hypothetical protein
VAGATFVNRLITQVQLIGAAEFSKRIIGIGTSHSTMASRVDEAAKRVIRANEQMEASQKRMEQAKANMVKSNRARRLARTDLLDAASLVNNASQKRMAAAQASAVVASAYDAAKQTATAKSRNLKQAQAAELNRVLTMTRLRNIINDPASTMGQVKAAGRSYKILEGREGINRTNIRRSQLEKLEADVALSRAAQDLAKNNERLRASENGVAAARANLKKKTDDLNKANSQHGKNIGDFVRSRNQFQRSSDRHRGAEDTQARLLQTKNTMDAVARSTMVHAAAIAAFFTALDWSKKIIQTAMEFQKFRMQLNFLYHDARKGGEAFAWVQKFAERTPFTVESTMEAMRTMIAMGINPTAERMKLLGGMADLFQRDFADAAKAVGFALAGNFSRMQRGFAITRQEVQRFSKVKLFDGKNQVRDVEALRKAIFALMRAKYGGYIDEMGKSATVAITNVGDAWRNMLSRIGAGQLDSVTKAAERIKAALDNVDAEKILPIMMVLKALTAAILALTGLVSGLFALINSAIIGVATGLALLVEMTGRLTGNKEMAKYGYDAVNRGMELEKLNLSVPLEIFKAAMGVGKSIGSDWDQLQKSRAENQAKANPIYWEKQGKTPFEAFAMSKKYQQMNAGLGQNTSKNKAFNDNPPGIVETKQNAGSQLASQFVREVIGGSKLAQIGVRPSELPGIQERMGGGLTMRLETGEGEDLHNAMAGIVQEVLRTLNRHGLAPPVRVQGAR